MGRPRILSGHALDSTAQGHDAEIDNKRAWSLERRSSLLRQTAVAIGNPRGDTPIAFLARVD
jgi:hypothetical protein